MAEVTDGVENILTGGSINGKPGILLFVFKSSGANVISTVDNVLALLPRLRASVPPAMKIDVAIDRTTTIRASVKDVTRTLIISILLVILVVYFFLREVRATLIPSVSVPLSLLGTFGVMYLLGYTLDNLSLMALTISTGFVVDDAIVVIENITRHLEAGMSPYDAAMLGSKEIGFTVLSMSTSLIAVFIPILLMGGIVGRLFREFAVTLSAAIVVSLVVSLTTTPMLTAKFLKAHTAGDARVVLPDGRPGAGLDDAGVRTGAAGGAATAAAGAGDHHPDFLSDDLPVQDRAEGLLSAAGYGAGDGGHSRPAGCELRLR